MKSKKENNKAQNRLLKRNLEIFPEDKSAKQTPTKMERNSFEFLFFFLIRKNNEFSVCQIYQIQTVELIINLCAEEWRTN
ncbi:hypothetical protein BpHYR1_009737 [Brachionus plicatilis]|uniref:Uncharacterized protein n=1 Tax=Brachionus plicatilis TaxID=10195 RepID=A0A3M7R3V6_BRAPC|nr:hypothetical protein BpHYR1_009737 [Brachionus plicatilis]